MILHFLARYRIARRLDGGRYVFRGSSGEKMVEGRIVSKWFSVHMNPARVVRGGIVKRVDVFRHNGKLAVQFKPKAFTVSSGTVFAGKDLALV